MKTVRCIDNSPEFIPEGKFLAVHCDNKNYYYLETKKEVDLYAPSPIINEKKLLIQLFESCTSEELLHIKQLLK
ncbi:MAG: hypothetical protein AABW88_01020 [Nanoarchaeota archaeon]